jgi:hypothetical protein
VKIKAFFAFFGFLTEESGSGRPKNLRIRIRNTATNFICTEGEFTFFNRYWISLFDVLPGSWLGSNIQVSEAYLERLSDAAMETYAMVATLSRYFHRSIGGAVLVCIELLRYRYYCGFRSGRIHIIFPDPDSDLHKGLRIRILVKVFQN